MLTLLPGGRILVAVEPVDGRKGIDSLAGVVRAALLGDPMSGDLSVFKNRRGDKLKILAWGTGSPSTSGGSNAAPSPSRSRRTPASLSRRRNWP
jgi:IS66 Orf2 like protein